MSQRDYALAAIEYTNAKAHLGLDPAEWDGLPYYLQELYTAGLELSGVSTRLSTELEKKLIDPEPDGSDSLGELQALGLKVQNV